MRGLDAAVVFADEQGVRLLDETLSDYHDIGVMPPGRQAIEIEIPGHFAPGRYPLTVWVGTEEEDFFYDEVFLVEILPRSEDRMSQVKRRRVIQPPVRWRHPIV